MSSLWSGLARRLLGLAPCREPRRLKGFHHAGGQRFPGGIRYYPRFPKHKDPVFEPSKLFRIERIKGIKGTTRIERRILELFKLGTEGQMVSISKNIPEMNSKLWKIKHLIRVTPITFPYGEPTPNDVNHTILKENGECIVRKELKIDESRIEAWDKFKENPARMDGGTLAKFSRLKWLNGWSGGY